MHVMQLALGQADLVIAAGWHDDARAILGVLAEAQHVAGQALHRPHQHDVERREDQARDDEREDDRQHQDVEPIAPHRLAQRFFQQRDLDEVARHVGRLVDDADHPRSPDATWWRRHP